MSELYWHNIETIKHKGLTYTVDFNGDGDAKAEYVDYADKGHDRLFRFSLSGAHDGDPIEVWMVNPRPEFDDGGYTVEYDKLLWADNYAPFVDDALVETYAEALHDEMRSVINETWD